MMSEPRRQRLLEAIQRGAKYALVIAMISWFLGAGFFGAAFIAILVILLFAAPALIMSSAYVMAQYSERPSMWDGPAKTRLQLTMRAFVVLAVLGAVFTAAVLYALPPSPERKALLGLVVGFYALMVVVSFAVLGWERFKVRWMSRGEDDRELDSGSHSTVAPKLARPELFGSDPLYEKFYQRDYQAAVKEGREQYLIGPLPLTARIRDALVGTLWAGFVFVFAILCVNWIYIAGKLTVDGVQMEGVVVRAEHKGDRSIVYVRHDAHTGRFSVEKDNNLVVGAKVPLVRAASDPSIALLGPESHFLRYVQRQYGSEILLWLLGIASVLVVARLITRMRQGK